VTERLIAVGASTQGADTEGRTLLHWAAWHGCEATVNALLAEPCVDVNAADIKGRTAMHLAAHAGQVNVMQRLAAAGAKRRVKDVVGRRPIDYCTAGDWKTRVRLASVLNNPTQAVVHFFTACTSLQG
jgi:ankyrin repeat protein